jgi:phosphatidate cytidylyltransferase
MDSHIKRLITGIIVVPVLIALIVFPYRFSDIVFLGIIVAVILRGIFEYNRMVFDDEYSLEKYEGLFIGILIPLAAHVGGLPLMSATATFSFFIVFLLFLFRIKAKPTDLTVLIKVIFGYMYIAFMMSHFILLRGFENGALWVVFMVVITFSSDISAFYAGKTFGKRKLFPEISEKKTEEGAIGSVVGTILGCLIFKILFLSEIPFVHAIVIGFMGGILGQLGDLCESSIKRVSMVKDSGSLLPGHGGILDRLDSFIFIIPFVYYYSILFIK